MFLNSSRLSASQSFKREFSNNRYVRGTFVIEQVSLDNAPSISVFPLIDLLRARNFLTETIEITHKTKPRGHTIVSDNVYTYISLDLSAFKSLSYESYVCHTDARGRLINVE